MEPSSTTGSGARGSAGTASGFGNVAGTVVVVEVDVVDELVVDVGLATSSWWRVAVVVVARRRGGGVVAAATMAVVSSSPHADECEQRRAAHRDPTTPHATVCH